MFSDALLNFLGEYIVNINKCNFLSLKVEKEMKREEFHVGLKKSEYYMQRTGRFD